MALQLLSALLRSLAGDAVVEAHASEGPAGEPLPCGGAPPVPPPAGCSAEKGSEPLEDPLLPEGSADVTLLLPASGSASDASSGAGAATCGAPDASTVDAAQGPDTIAAWQPQGGSTLWEVQPAGHSGSTSRKPGAPAAAGAKAAWSPAKASPSKGGSPGKAKLALSKLLGCGGGQHTSPTLSAGLEAAAQGSPQRR